MITLVLREVWKENIFQNHDSFEIKKKKRKKAGSNLDQIFFLQLVS